jgi:hypothetical protein
MSTSSPEPSDRAAVETEALDGILVVIEGPADTTHRPRRPNVPLPPTPEPPPAQPPAETP